MLIQGKDAVSAQIVEDILYCASDAIISTDERQRIILFNKQAEDIFGYEVHEVIGKPLDMLLPNKFRSGHAKQAQGFAAENKARRRMNERTEVRGLKKNGEEFSAEVAISKFLQEGKYFFTAILRDVTERKEAEANVNRYAAELERRNRDLADFSFIASHDLQEPLRKIITYADRISTRVGSLDERAKDDLAKMMGSVERMRCRLEALLEYSMASSCDHPLQALSLGEVVSEVLAEMDIAPDSPEGRIEVHQLPVIESGKFKTHQLFRNLISNAVKYGKKHQPYSVVISARSIENGFWEILVRDDGIGFDQKYADRIFRPFERLSNEVPGSGMGLAICNRVVDQLGGAIKVKSATDQGTTVIIHLPEKHNPYSNSHYKQR